LNTPGAAAAATSTAQSLLLYSPVRGSLCAPHLQQLLLQLQFRTLVIPLDHLACLFLLTAPAAAAVHKSSSFRYKAIINQAAGYNPQVSWSTRMLAEAFVGSPLSNFTSKKKLKTQVTE
jgi:hypothetical protein